MSERRIDGQNIGCQNVREKEKEIHNMNEFKAAFHRCKYLC